MKRILLLFTFLFVLGTFSFSKPYYIRTDGNDNNDGSQNTAAKAWRSIAAKAGTLNPGDVLWIADGTYSEGEIKLENKAGSDANRIVIRAINSKQAKISSISVWSAINITNCTGITIQDLEVSFSSGSTNEQYCIISEESNFVTIKNNTVHNAGCSGIQLNMSDNLLVEGNYVYGCASRSAYNGSGISVGFLKAKSNSGATYAVIIRNNISQGNYCNLPFTYGGQTVVTVRLD
jgi:parallel beta-helix repeat protein